MTTTWEHVDTDGEFVTFSASIPEERGIGITVDIDMNRAHCCASIFVSVTTDDGPDIARKEIAIPWGVACDLVATAARVHGIHIPHPLVD